MNFYKEACRLAEARFHRELFLGRGKHTGRLYFARPEDFLATHMHLIGASNFGKSFYLEHLLRAFIELGIAASLIDPHGDRARSYLRFLQRKSRLVRERRILHLAPGSSSSELGFNPFACGLSDPGARAVHTSGTTKVRSALLAPRLLIMCCGVVRHALVPDEEILRTISTSGTGDRSPPSRSS